MIEGSVFLDTVGLIALWDQSDQWHHSAHDAFAELDFARQPLVTTSFVLLECGNAAARRAYRSSVDDLRKTLEASAGLIFPEEGDWQQAWLAYQRGDAAQAGIVDQVSFVIMQRLNLRCAFTNDAHFRAAGFETLF